MSGNEHEARAMLQQLVEAGLVDAHGIGRGRTYTLSAKVYRTEGKKSDYVRQAGFEALQQEQMVLKYIDTHGRIKRADVMELCRVSPDQASKLLQRLKASGKIAQRGERKGAYYERA